MDPIHVSPEREIREAVATAFAAHRARVLGVVPEADVEHVGATAVSGALTKGDLDLLVRVEAARFEAAVTLLRAAYHVHQPENWTTTYASFVDSGETNPPVGIQLVVAGSRDDELFRWFRDALISDPAFLPEYNALKQSHDGLPYARYTEAKAVFIEQRLGR